MLNELLQQTSQRAADGLLPRPHQLQLVQQLEHTVNHWSQSQASENQLKQAQQLNHQLEAQAETAKQQQPRVETAQAAENISVDQLQQLETQVVALKKQVANSLSSERLAVETAETD